MRFDPKDFDPRFRLEPRALWTTSYLIGPAAATSALSGRVDVNKDHFRNTTIYPITLTHCLMCGVGYPAQFNFNGGLNGMNGVDFLELYVSAPYSQAVANNRMRISSLPAEAVSTPGVLYDVNSLTPANTYFSSLLGLNRWDFDFPFTLPRKARIEMDVGTWIAYVDAAPISIAMNVEEPASNKFGGSSRLRDRQELPPALSSSPGVYPQVFYAPLVGGEVAGVGTAFQWPPEGRFTAQEFNRQDADRGQDFNLFSGFGVAIDQITYDEALAGVYGDPTFVAAPLSTFVGTQMRVSAGGSGQWWWRPGAPLALVTPTLNNAAQVHRLPFPVTLNPGEQLEVELSAPVFPGSAESFNLGLSFTGYASIETVFEEPRS